MFSQEYKNIVGLSLKCKCVNIFFLGMTDFDRTLTSFNMQDEQRPTVTRKTATGIINANAFSKVKEAMANAFAQPVPVLA